MRVVYDQAEMCCPNCPQIVEIDGQYKLHDPDFPGQGAFTFKGVKKLRERFDVALATHSLTVYEPGNPDAGSYSFKNHGEMSIFAENAFTALEAA